MRWKTSAWSIGWGARYAIGSGLATLTHDAAPVGSLRELVRPYLIELTNALGENASLGIADGDALLYLDTVSGESVVQVQDWTGERVPLHATAAGLALMASWTDAEVSAYAADGLDVLTEETVGTLTALRRRLRSVRAAGCAWTLGDFSDEVNGIGAVIVGAHGVPVGAVSVHGPTFRFPSHLGEPTITAAVTDAAARISAHFARR